ncbi:MAG: 23S rRNA (uridine(2552)-2'-O)-methyltransferase RlmE [Gammaproteobacteria bacterium]|nr:23S rRNA (uridine(2552)-2'-O)-methyltransferase RlmE [Gammaproteobacteria bacterium]
MSRSKSSKKWLKEHFEDEFVQRSQKDGYRSRAIYKLIEIQEKDRLIKPGMTVIDLGAAPGGWSEYAAKLLGKKGRMIALDILPMEPIPDVHIIEGDFRENEVLEILLEAIGKDKADLVFSDMAPNISGMEVVDIPRSYYLAELTLDLAQRVLKPGGGMLVKLFQGEGFDDYLKALRENFSRVVIRKPRASRARSREIYALATGFKL